MNEVVTLLGVESWKPILTALLLPPVPFLLLVLVGARLILPRRGWGWSLILLSVAGLWLSACTGSAQFLTRFVLKPPPALSAAQVQELKAAARGKPTTAIVALGGGMEPVAPEYRVANLTPASLERLRYGVWLSRETGLPLGFSGGVGWSQKADGTAEALIASRIAQQEFNRPLRWVEGQSRDTRENANRSVALLKADGIQQIVLVTHGYHLPRALRVFEQAAGDSIRIVPAPMGLARHTMTPVMEWLPTTDGFQDTRRVLRELLGLWVGA